MRKLTGLLLLGFAVASLATSIAYAEADGSPRVIATYFHGTFRCQTCLHIESLARYDVTDVMASDIESGQLIWRSLNFEKEENARYQEQFKLEGSTLIITLEDGGEVLKWVQLDRVWDLYDNSDAFDKYVMGTIEEYLIAASEIAGDNEQPE